MVSKKTVLGLVISSLVLLAIVHTIFHLAVYGTTIPGFYQRGVSGFSVGKVELGDEFKQHYPNVSPISKSILVAEWVLLLIVIIATFIRTRINFKKEFETIKLKGKYPSEGNKTDLATLYEVLKEKKHLTLNTIARMFNVEKDVAKSWCETLESGGLATLHYHRIGDPEVVLN